jgi:hypothetical protein
MRVTYSDHLIFLVWITTIIGILSISWRVQFTKNSQKMSRPTGKRGTVSSWQCQTPYSPNNPEENSRTTVGTSWTSALQAGLGPKWLPFVRSAKNPHSWQTSRCWWRDWNGGAEVAETTVRRPLCCGFRRTGKATGHLYQCWWGYVEK